MMTKTNKNLFNLDELSGYKVAENYSDVRGWDVKDANNRIIGKVDHLLVNKTDERVVYLDVEVDETLIEEEHNTYQSKVNEGLHEFVNKEGENHLIIPIGMAVIDEKNKSVNTNQIDSSTFAKAKRFTKGDAIDFAYELYLVRHYGRDNTIHNSNSVDGFYDREEFNNTFHRKE
ncbi:PRC-barrel domain-containing protein [Flavobacterium cellulosilyticum]|uniref:Photosystem reaction center subunit H n=1 Tax=Flavobacterium cellulosilyticum TaxID=2541731 RepID=A0A4R5CDE8_9FLAO|nr:PRC-barrel domain-containing protein [Flavobacterium cellulosilyticum]TDD96886.1 photosystem reaction center subunit H [Flavobacterium cellulosilyticum]